MSNIIFANLINIFHIFIILFVLFIPFTNITYYLIIHVTLCLSLIIHWLSNNDTCSLSLFESYLRGISYKNSFSHKFIAPIYNISHTDWSRFCYIITIFVMLISIYKIYNNGKISYVYQLYKTQKKQNIPYFIIYNNCIKELLS